MLPCQSEFGGTLPWWVSGCSNAMEPMSHRLGVGVRGHGYPRYDSDDRVPQGSPKGPPQHLLIDTGAHISAEVFLR